MSISDTRVSELLDYATGYGEYDENSPDGSMCNDYRRDSIRALKEVQSSRRRIQDLLEANNRYLERAREAEGFLRKLTKDQVPPEWWTDNLSWDLGCSAGDVREIMEFLNGPKTS